MKHYFTFEEIQNLSYFDFKLYTEAINNEEIEQAKLRDEEIQSMNNANSFNHF